MITRRKLDSSVVDALGSFDTQAMNTSWNLHSLLYLELAIFVNPLWLTFLLFITGEYQLPCGEWEIIIIIIIVIIHLFRTYQTQGVYGIPPTRNSVCFLYFRVFRILSGIAQNSAELYGIPCHGIRQNSAEFSDFWCVEIFTNLTSRGPFLLV